MQRDECPNKTQYILILIGIISLSLSLNFIKLPHLTLNPNSWRLWMAGTARELFREFGCSERVYQDAFNPMLLVGLFAPGELCSAAACLGMLYYFILAHQVLNSSVNHPLFRALLNY